MEDDFLLAFAGHGVEFGMRIVRDIPSSAPSLEAVAEMVVERSAMQASCICKSLGLAHHVDAVAFARVVGLLAGSTGVLITQLTGQQISVAEDAVPNAGNICMRAFKSMRR